MATLQRPAAPIRTVSNSSFAESFDIARRKLDKELDGNISSPDSRPGSPASLATGSTVTPAELSTPLTPFNAAIDADPDVADEFAFAFDIDGVLIRGGKVIPEAIEAMKVLNGENEYGVKV